MADIESRGQRLLLISNSTLYGSGYLDHAEKEIRDFLRAVGRVLFVPFAQHERDAYAASARRRGIGVALMLREGHEQDATPMPPRRAGAWKRADMKSAPSAGPRTRPKTGKTPTR